MNQSKKLWIAIGIAIMLCVTIGLTACGKKTQEHNLIFHEAKKASCTEDGNTAYWSCNHCDKLFSDADGKTEVAYKDVVIEKVAHTLPDSEHHVAVPSTCTENGNYEYWHCTACGQNFRDAEGKNRIDDVVDYASHTLVRENRIEPTLDATGKEGHYYCTTCHKFYLDDKAQTEVEEGALVLQKLPEYSVTVSLAVKDVNGNAVTEYSEIGKLTFKLVDKPFEKTYTASIDAGGQIALNKMGAGCYEVSASGYYTSVLTVREQNEQNAILYLDALEHTLTVPQGHPEYVTALREEDGTHVLVFQTPFAGGQENTTNIELKNTNIKDENYLLDFTLAIRGDFDRTAWDRRFFIELGKSDNKKDITGFILLTTNGNLQTAQLQASHIFDDMTANVAVDANLGDAFYDAASKDGVNLRVMRTGNTVALYMLSAGKWVLLRSFDIARGCTNKVALFSAGPDKYTVSGIDFATYTAQENPTEESEGKEAYFYKDGKYYSTTNEEKTESELTIPKLAVKQISIDVTFKTDAQTLSAPASIEATFIPVRGKTYATDIVNGKITSFDIAEGTYTVRVAGYEDTVFTVNNATESGAITLYKQAYTIENPVANSDKITVRRDSQTEYAIFGFDNAWDNYQASTYVELTDSVITGKHYAVDFIVRYITITSAWKSRFVVQMGSGSGNTAITFTPISNEGKDIEVYMLNTDDPAEGNNSVQYTVGFRALFTDGAHMRAIRSGNTVTLLLRLENGQWFTLKQMTVPDSLAAHVSFRVKSDDKIEVTGVSFAEYVQGKAPTLSAEGMLAHFEIGSEKFTPDGEVKTDMSIPRIEEKDVTVTAAVTDKNGNAVSAPNVTVRCVHVGGLAEYANVTVNGGELSQTKFVAGTYRVYVEGYYVTEFTVTESGTADTVYLDEIEHTITVPSEHPEYIAAVRDNEGDHTLILETPWKDGDDPQSYVQLQSEKITGNHYLAQFELRIDGDFDRDDWNRRFALVLSDAQSGVSGFLLNTTKSDGLRIGAYSVGNRCFDVAGDNIDSSALSTAFMSGAQRGVTLRMLRSGNSIRLFMKNGNSWLLVHSLTIADGSAKVAIGSSSPDKYTFSKISFGTYVPGKSPTVDEKGILAHFEIDGEVFTPDGASIIDIPKIEVNDNISVNVTVKRQDDIVIDESIIKSLVLTLVHESGKEYENVTITDGKLSVSNLAKGTYSVTVTNDYRYDTGTFAVGDAATAELTLCIPPYRIVNPNGGDLLTNTGDANNPTFTFHNQWYGYVPGVYAELFDGSIAGDKYAIDFYVKFSEEYDENTYKDHFNLSRFIVEMGTGDLRGVTFHGQNSNDDNGHNGVGSRLVAHNYSTDNLDQSAGHEQWSEFPFYELFVLQAKGAHMRAIRHGTAVTYLVQMQDGSWQNIGSIELAQDSQAKIILRARNNLILSFADFTYAEYVVAKDAQVGIAGNVAHFIIGNDKVLPNGTVTESVAIPALRNVAVNVTVKHQGIPVTDESVLNRLAFMVKDAQGNTVYSDVTLSNGKLSVTNWSSGTYTVFVSNNTAYDSTTLVVTDDDDTYSIEIDMPILGTVHNPYGGDYAERVGDSITFHNPWDSYKSDVYLEMTDSRITGDRYAVETYVKFENLTEGQERICRFFIGMGQPGENALTGLTFEPGSVNGDRLVLHKYAGNNLNGELDEVWLEFPFKELFLDAMRGAHILAVRNGKTVTYYVEMQTGGWRSLWELTLPDNCGAAIILRVRSNYKITFSDVHVTDVPSVLVVNPYGGNTVTVTGENPSITINNPWDGYKNDVYVELYDEKITGTQYGVEFTVKYGAFVSGANDRTYRFSVEMGTGASSDLKGMTFDPGNTEDNRVVVNKSPSDLDGGGYEQWNEANFCVHAEGGARMRAVRNGKTVTYYILETNGDWKQIDSFELPDNSQAKVILRVRSAAPITFSNISFFTPAE